LSAERVLVDTSVWIEYFRGGDPSVTGIVEALIKGGAVVTAGIILAELLQGARTDREVEIIEDMKDTFEWISLERSDESWIRAGKLSRDLRRAGNAVHLTDCLIAVLAVENRCRVASLDAHFRMIAEVLPIELAL
jgi:predicted nucleic acid-binding protein